MAELPPEGTQARDRNDLSELLARHPGLPAARLVELLRADQRQRWQRGERVPAEAYLRDHTAVQSDEEAALDLIYSEFVLREDLGETPTFEEYFQRFPQYRPRLERQFRVHQALAWGSTEGRAGSTGGQGGGPDAAPPAVIGKYQVVQALDGGGQARVFRALHPGLGKDVVIKLSRQPLRLGSADRDRLLAEGRILAQLEHPNLARVFDLDLHEDRVFLVMEYVRGRTLEQCAREGRLAPRQAAALVAKVARALAVAHARGVTHHDLKPRNILIDETGEPRLIDFGLARVRDAWEEDAVASGAVWGTAAYMAPEQARGEVERVGPCSDVFGLGAVLHMLLVGAPPFAGATVGQSLERARRCDWDRAALRRVAVPRRLASACERALAAEPAGRYPRAEDLAADLEACARPRRLPVVLLVVGVVLLLAVAALGWAALGPKATGPTLGNKVVAARPVSLTLRIWRNGQPVNLLGAAPLQAGDDLRIEAEAPEDAYAAVFLFTSEGRLRELAARVPAADAGPLAYPEVPGKAAPLVGPPGTEVVLVCGGASGPVSSDEVRELWQSAGPWPALPGQTVLRLDRERVVVVQRDRDVGLPHDVPDPEGEVRRRLEEAGRRLSGRFECVAALAVAHR
jgi:tRNA A-37 threonylcarbamoyl transferase component Bud32